VSNAVGGRAVVGCGKHVSRAASPGDMASNLIPRSPRQPASIPRPWPQQGSESLTLSPPSASPPTRKETQEALASCAINASSVSAIRCWRRRGSLVASSISFSRRLEGPRLPFGRAAPVANSSSMVTPRAEARAGRTSPRGGFAARSQKAILDCLTFIESASCCWVNPAA
jgi:hypothetical protein